MTVQKKRSVEPKVRADVRRNGRQNGEGPDGTDIGWGLSAESQEEDIFLRRVLFFVIVAVLGCMGAWFLVTTVSGGNQPRGVLSATDNAPVVHTVRLLEFRALDAKKAAAVQMSQSAELKAIAGGHEFSLVEQPEGRCALCVGKVREADSPELHRLLREFRDYRDGGQQLFADAQIVTIRE